MLGEEAPGRCGVARATAVFEPAGVKCAVSSCAQATGQGGASRAARSIKGAPFSPPPTTNYGLLSRAGGRAGGGAGGSGSGGAAAAVGTRGGLPLAAHFSHRSTDDIRLVAVGGAARGGVGDGGVASASASVAALPSWAPAELRGQLAELKGGSSDFHRVRGALMAAASKAYRARCSSRSLKAKPRPNRPLANSSDMGDGWDPSVLRGTLKKHPLFLREALEP